MPPLSGSPRHPRTMVIAAVAILAIVAAAAPHASAQSLTLSDAAARARAASPQVAAAREALRSAVAAARQARATPNPVLSVQHESANRSGFDDNQVLLTVDQTLDLPQRAARIAAADARGVAAEARLADAEALSDLAVVRAFTQAVAAARRAQLARDAAADFARARAISAIRLGAGDVSGYADRRLRLEAARYGALAAEADLAATTAHHALLTLLTAAPAPGPTGAGATAVPAALPAAGDLAPPDTPPDALVTAALTRRPDLLAVRADARAAAQDAVGIARGRIPVPVLTAGLKRADVTGVGALAGIVAGITVPLPLWDRRTGAVLAGDADARRAGALVDGVERQVAEEVRAAVAGVLAIDAQLAVLAPELGDSARVALRAAEVAYAEGEIPLVEWLDAVRARHEAEAAFASLAAEAIIRRAELRRAAGLPILGPLP